jgi:hypothetical protein
MGGGRADSAVFRNKPFSDLDVEHVSLRRTADEQWVQKSRQTFSWSGGGGSSYVMQRD